MADATVVDAPLDDVSPLGHRKRPAEGGYTETRKLQATSTDARSERSSDGMDYGLRVGQSAVKKAHNLAMQNVVRPACFCLSLGLSSVCLCLSVCLLVCRPQGRPQGPVGCLSVCLCVCVSVCLSVCLSLWLSGSLALRFCLCLPAHPTDTILCAWFQDMDYYEGS